MQQQTEVRQTTDKVKRRGVVFESPLLRSFFWIFLQEHSHVTVKSPASSLAHIDEL